MSNKLGSIILIIIGSLIMIFDYYKFVKPVNRFIENSETAFGIVVSDNTKLGGVVKEYPMVEYTDKKSSISYKTSLSEKGRILKYKVGEKLKIYYDPNDNYIVKQDDKLVLYNEAILLSLFGLPFFIFGILMLILGFIVKRDSFFDLSESINSYSLGAAKLFAIIIAGLWMILFFMKSLFDIPDFIYTTPYLVLSFVIMFILNITQFIFFVNKFKHLKDKE